MTVDDAKTYATPKAITLGVVLTGEAVLTNLLSYNGNGIVTQDDSNSNRKVFIPYHNIAYIEEQ